MRASIPGVRARAMAASFTEMRASFTETMGSIPEYSIPDYAPSFEHETQAHYGSDVEGGSKLKARRWEQSCSDSKASVSAALRLESGSQLCDDACFGVQPDSILPDSPCDDGSWWSVTEDEDRGESTPGQVLFDTPEACRSPLSKTPSPLRPGASVRVTLHNAPADKGLAAVASVEYPEDGSPCRLRICRGAATLALFELDGKSISISLVSAPSLTTTFPGILRNASEWIKVSCEGGGDIYACAALGWRALMPFLYPTPGNRMQKRRPYRL